MTKKQTKILFRIILSAVITICGYLTIKFAPINLQIWQLVIYALPYSIIGYDVLFSAIKNIFHKQFLDEKFLMTIATIGAFSTGEFPEAVMVMLFYQLGELFQSVAVGKSRKSIATLMDIRPDIATVIRDGQEFEVSPDEVNVGEIIIIKAGEKIPLDGIIISGSTSVDASALTGESLPQSKTEGDNIVSGSVNINGLIKVKTTSSFGESTVSKILELVENSAEKKSKSENFITKFAKYYTPIVVACAFLLAVVPPLFIGISSWAVWSAWINRAMVFLVVSCPCALVISVPLSFFGGIGGASKAGILIKGSNYLEKLSKVDTVVFDKTGTMTKGCFKVTAVHPLEMTERQLLNIAALAESHSTHPIAESIAQAAEYNGHIDKSRIGDIEELAGLGIKAIIDGKPVYVGNDKLMDMINVPWKKCHLSGTTVHIASDETYFGHIIISDELKPDAIETISGLKNAGVKKTVMLTGDTHTATQSVCKNLPIDEVFTDLLPGQKVLEVEKLLNEKSTVAFVGDGINDAPVLSRADIGIAMGAIGSDAAIEAADIVIMDDKPSKIVKAIITARKTMRLVYENIGFALAVKFAVLVLGACGIANMWLAVFADVGVTVIAVLNAMRALKIQ